MQHLTHQDAITSNEKVNALLGDFLNKRTQSGLTVTGFNPQMVDDREPQDVVIVCKERYPTDVLAQLFHGVKGLFTTRQPLCLGDVVNDLNAVLGHEGTLTFRVVQFDPETQDRSVLDRAIADVQLRTNNQKAQVITTDYLGSKNKGALEFMFA